MNGDQPSLEDVDPSWVDSGGIFAFQPAYPPFGGDDSPWDTSVDTIGIEPGEDFIPPPANVGCLDEAGDPPGSGTWVLGSVGGTCQWIDTTTCP